jgi:hypothetical protein
MKARIVRIVVLGFWMFCVFTLATMVASCGINPTAPDEYLTEKEVWLAERVADHARTLEAEYEIKVQFHENRINGKEAGADIQARVVKFWREYVANTDRLSLDFTAAHEVCHIVLFTGNETLASSCASDILVGR